MVVVITSKHHVSKRVVRMKGIQKVRVILMENPGNLSGCTLVDISHTVY
jgi:hypothetical protein